MNRKKDIEKRWTEDHSYDALVSKPFSAYTSAEKHKLTVLAGLLIDAGLLWTEHDKNELPVLVAGLAKHCKLERPKAVCAELIALINAGRRKAISDSRKSNVPLAANKLEQPLSKPKGMYRGTPVSD